MPRSDWCMPPTGQSRCRKREEEGGPCIAGRRRRTAGWTMAAARTGKKKGMEEGGRREGREEGVPGLGWLGTAAPGGGVGWRVAGGRLQWRRRLGTLASQGREGPAGCSVLNGKGWLALLVLFDRSNRF